MTSKEYQAVAGRKLSFYLRTNISNALMGEGNPFTMSDEADVDGSLDLFRV